MRKGIRVLIVDDSALVRRILTDIISQEEGLEIAGTANNGVEAIKAIGDLKPDIVTMDINMPEMDGLAALEYIMKKDPLPVLMISAIAQKGAVPTLKALELGAVDYIAKPSRVSSSVKEIREEILLKIKTAAETRNKLIAGKPARIRKHYPARSRSATGRVVVIGASAGGPRALSEIMPFFPKEIKATFFVVQHMPGAFTRTFADRLNQKCGIQVREAQDGDIPEEGVALVAPGGFDMRVKSKGTKRRIELSSSNERTGASPSIDTTMESLAESYGERVIGVVLTGMGSDGAYGMSRIKQNDGYTIAQSEETCLVYGMPKSVIERSTVDRIAHLNEIPEEIIRKL